MNIVQHTYNKGTSGCVGTFRGIAGHLAVYSERGITILYRVSNQPDPDNGGDVPVPHHFQPGHVQHAGIFGHHPECSNNYSNMVLPQIAESGNVPCQHTETVRGCFPLDGTANGLQWATQRGWWDVTGDSPVRTWARHVVSACSTVLSNVWTVQAINFIRKTPRGLQLSVDTQLFRRGNPRTTTDVIFRNKQGPHCGNQTPQWQHGLCSNMDLIPGKLVEHRPCCAGKVKHG